MIREWEILHRKIVLNYGLFQVEKKRVLSPRTNRESDALGILFPDWVIVLPLTKDNQVVMVRQYRHGNEKICLELPGGLLDSQDEMPIDAARREMMEETGYAGEMFSALGQCFPQPAILKNRCHFVLASDVHPVSSQDLDAGEDIEVLQVPMYEIPCMIQTGKISNGMVMQTFLLYWMERCELFDPGR